MSRDSILVVILVVLCCAIAALALVLALAVGGGLLAKRLMGFLRQLYGDEHNTENDTDWTAPWS